MTSFENFVLCCSFFGTKTRADFRQPVGFCLIISVSAADCLQARRSLRRRARCLLFSLWWLSALRRLLSLFRSDRFFLCLCKYFRLSAEAERLSAESSGVSRMGSAFNLSLLFLRTNRSSTDSIFLLTPS